MDLPEAVRLQEAAHRTRVVIGREEEFAADDAALVRLRRVGQDLLNALSHVQKDETFWDGLRIAARRSALVPEKQRAGLAALAESQLAPMLGALNYEPPPEMVEFIGRTLGAVRETLDSTQSPLAREEQVEILAWELAAFTQRLRRLLKSARLPKPSLQRRLRSTLSKGSDTATSLAVAAAGVGAEAGFTALGIPGIGGPLGQVIATAVMKDATRRLAEIPEAEEITALDPVTRTNTSARILEARLAEARDDSDEYMLHLASNDLERLRRSVRRLPSQLPEFSAALTAVDEHLAVAREAVDAADHETARTSLTDALVAAERVRTLSGHPPTPNDPRPTHLWRPMRRRTTCSTSVSLPRSVGRSCAMRAESGRS